jgi:hypothetical protein
MVPNLIHFIYVDGRGDHRLNRITEVEKGSHDGLIGVELRASAISQTS